MIAKDIQDLIDDLNNKLEWIGRLPDDRLDALVDLCNDMRDNYSDQVLEDDHLRLVDFLSHLDAVHSAGEVVLNGTEYSWSECDGWEEC